MTMKEIGEKIAYIRRAKGWSRNMAGQIALVGGKQLKRIEEGTGNPRLSTLIRMADRWQVPIADFFTPLAKPRVRIKKPVRPGG